MDQVRLSVLALSFLYRLVRRLVEFLRIHRMNDVAKDAEILVLHHPLAVLRQVARPRSSWPARALVAALARLVPRERWAAFVITPETILRWQRALVRRRWTYPHRHRDARPCPTRPSSSSSGSPGRTLTGLPPHHGGAEEARCHGL